MSVVDSELADAELKAIYDKRVLPSVPLHSPEEAPAIVMVGGQPGAGKSKAMAWVRISHAGAYAVDTDEFRQFHPDYRRVMSEDPLSMPSVTAQAAGYWFDTTVDLLRENRNSLLLETTMRHPNSVERTLREFRDAGYRTEAVVVAVPEELSLMGVMMRYVGQTERDGAGRWVPPEVHDEAYRQMPETLAGAIREGLLDHVAVTDRAGSILYESDVAQGNRDVVASAAVDAIAAGRQFGSITSDQREQWDRDVAHVEAFVAVHPEEHEVRRLAGRVVTAAEKAEQGRLATGLADIAHARPPSAGLGRGVPPARTRGQQPGFGRGAGFER